MTVERQEGRGQLKIYLGYACGVGKRAAMLTAARRLLVAGADLVVGHLPVPADSDLALLMTGMELIPPRLVGDHGRPPTPEMDTDAILARRPQIVLIDYLFHTNAPGCRHTYRYQDLLELLNSGIDVHTTMNIYHLESIHDIVLQVTGVHIRDTVPDAIFDSAGDISLVDMPVVELLAKLQDVPIKDPHMDAPTGEKFYRQGNLTAMREMAMRRTAERVDEQMREYMQHHAITGPWPAGERLLVCVGPSPLSERLVRTTRRLARRLDAVWFALYVETAGRRLSDAAADRVAITLQLAEDLGAQVVRRSGQDIAETITNVAMERNITKIVIGKPLRSRWQEWRHGSIVNEIIRRTHDLDVYVISGEADLPVDGEGKGRRGRSRSSRWQEYLFGLLLVLGATVTALPFRMFITPTNLVMFYLLAVVVAAVWLGRRPAVFAALVGVILFDIVYVPPLYTLKMADAEYLLTFAGLLAVVLVISRFSTRAREQEQAARRREEQTAALYDLSRKLAAVSGVADIAQTAVAHIQDTFQTDAALFLPATAGERPLPEASTLGFQRKRVDRDAVEWVLRHGQPAGRHTNTLARSDGYFLPLQSGDETIGVLAVELSPVDEQDLSTEQRRFLQSLTSQIALALEKARLADQARRAHLLAETEKLQTTLLNAISHDLRTPLATITGALSSLYTDATLLTSAAQQDLALMAWEEALRLNQLVGNLLDMTRLESGAMKVVRQPHDVQELVGAALTQMTNRLHGRSITRDIPADLPPVDIDFTLVVQALINLVDNAVKFTPAEKEITIGAHAEPDAVVIQVCDRGPGLPEGEEEQLFEKFFRVAAGGAGGIGLGLSIARGIVEAHHGRIWAENRPGGGALFSIALPRPDQPEDTL